MSYAFLAALVVVSVSLIGLLFSVSFLKSFLERNMARLVSFSAGVFAFAAYNLFSEAIHELTFYIAGICFLGGFLFFYLFDEIIFPESHHHHEEDCGDTHAHSSGRKILIGDSIHNIADGIVIGSAFLVSVPVGFIATVGVLIHEMLQEVSEYIVLINSGYSKTRAILWNIATSLTIFIGIFIAIKLPDLVSVESGLLAVSSGMFAYIVFHDLVPQKVLAKKQKLSRVLFFLLGIILLASLSMLIPHMH
jgi:zinc and cadmium transporter